jgi:outer membrane lipoprotein SlyB
VSEVRSNQYLWVAVGVLGVATVGLGAELLASRTNEAASRDPVVLMAANEPATAKVAAPENVSPAASSSTSEIVSTKSAAHSAPAHKGVPKPNAATTAKAAPNTAPVQQDAKAAVEPAPVNTPVVMPEQKPPLVICAVCGTVESVTAVEHDAAQGSGIGVIAGAALGGIVGNQFGGGAGKDLATIAGMAAGGWAGNTVEKKIKKETIFEVKVRMEDGTVRKLQQKTSIGVGTRVTVEGGKITPA